MRSCAVGSAMRPSATDSTQTNESPSVSRPPQVAPGPAPAREPPQGATARQALHAACRQVLVSGIGHVGAHQQHSRCPEVPRTALREAQGGSPADQGVCKQPAAFGAPGICMCTNEGGRHDHQQVTHREHHGPDQGCMGKVAHHHTNKISVKDRCEHHRRVSGVGKIQAGPGEYLSPGHRLIRQNGARDPHLSVPLNMPFFSCRLLRPPLH